MFVIKGLNVEDNYYDSYEILSIRIKVNKKGGEV